MKKTTQLKNLIENQDLGFILEAHNGLSAKIVEEAGFKGIWASGLTISASCGVRDNNELSWTQVLQTVEYMSDATDIPILLDGDTGYGNFNNMRLLVKKLEQRNVAGVCIEDKLFPKTNSFLRGEAQPLADVDEFCGKIKAGKDSQQDSDFVLVARVEAFIAGWGLEEALRRAEKYHEAGADAILMHSKLAHPSEIFAFLEAWDNRCPVVLVPTKYYATPTSAFAEKKVSLIIWANHLLRGAITKMQDIAIKIAEDQSLQRVEDEVASVSEIFRLQGDIELQEAEKRYLSCSAESQYSAIILAASRGRDLGKLTEDRPKAMIQIGSQSILERGVINLKKNGINQINVVAGYKKESIQIPAIQVLENPEYEKSGQMVSLSKALKKLSGATIVLFGDILFKKYIINLLIDEPNDIVIVVDSSRRELNLDRKSDYVYASKEHNQLRFDEEVILTKMVFSKLLAEYQGEWIGMLKLSPNGSKLVSDFIQEYRHKPEFSEYQIPDMLNHFVNQGIKVAIQYINGHWLDVDEAIDLSIANNF